MYLETSRIIYYGIDKENCKPKITVLAYSPEKGCYERRPETQGLTRNVFQKEIEKEVLLLEKIISKAQEDLQGCDLSSPRLYHGYIDSVRSVKDCPTASRLRLVPLPHSSSPYSCDKIERFWKETNISFKREYVIWK